MNPALEHYQPKLDELIGRGVHIPALPSQGAELLKLTRLPVESINLKRVVELVESEPTMTAMLLRLANSSRYGTSRTIRRVDHALFIVGLDEALSMLEFYLVRNMFPRWLNLPHFTAEGFWYHSWVTAHAAQMLGQPRFLVQSLPGELYIAGLLHDIGKAVMAVHFAEECNRCAELAQRDGITGHEAERQVFGLDHAILGAALLNRWMLPPGILDAVGCHHDPGQAAPEFRELAALVQLADAVAACGEGGLVGDDMHARIGETWIYKEGRSPLVREETLWPLIEEIRDRLDKDAADTLDPEDQQPGPNDEEDELPPMTMRPNPAAHRRQVHAGLFSRVCGWLIAVFRF